MLHRLDNTKDGGADLVRGGNHVSFWYHVSRRTGKTRTMYAVVSANKLIAMMYFQCDLV